MRLYDKYKVLKEEDKDKKYLFKSGNFYIFLDDDARSISEVTTLKVTNFGSNVKCGFPINSLEKYLTVFKNIGLDVVIVEKYEDIIRELDGLKLNDLSYDELINIIERFKNSI